MTTCHKSFAGEPTIEGFTICQYVCHFKNIFSVYYWGYTIAVVLCRAMSVRDQVFNILHCTVFFQYISVCHKFKRCLSIIKIYMYMYHIKTCK